MEKWLSAVGITVLLGCTGQIGSNAGDPPKGIDAPRPTPQATATRLRRLSHREYDAAVAELLGDETRPSRHFPIEVYTNGYDNGSADLTVQSDQLVAYQAAAETLAATAVAKDLRKLLGGCDVASAGEATCATSFFASFPRRAFRRPPREGEVARLRRVFDDARALGDFTLAVQTTVEAVLQSPGFLYREEIGAPAPASADTVPLTRWERATALAFFLTGGPPDELLAEAVDAGRFETEADLRREAVRLLATPKAKVAMRAFMHQWLGTKSLPDVRKDAAVYPAFDTTLSRAMMGELDRFIDDVVWARTGTLDELFTSNRSFGNRALADLYGVSLAEASFASALVPITLDPIHRKGILTRAGFLAVHGAPDHSSPVERGVFFRGALLCAPPAPPPPDVLSRTKTLPKGPGITTRARFAAHTSEAFCQGCHQSIDGIGFGFEQFDGIGRFRTEENGAPVDTSGKVLGTDDIDGPFVGVSELSERLVTSRQFARCYVTQVFRFAMGVAETPDDAEAIDTWTQDFASHRRVTDLMLALVTSPRFILRKRAP